VTGEYGRDDAAGTGREEAGHRGDADRSTRAAGSVRSAAPADRSALRDLQRHLPERSPDLLDYGVAVGDVLVSTAGGTPVGYLLTVHGDGAHVAELVVAPGRRREGWATALLDALFGSLADGERVTVAVDPHNDAARALYERQGFSLVERREEYFADGPALLLALAV
jgi:ribosomal-protein-alanine N-acetyltransferase